MPKRIFVQYLYYLLECFIRWFNWEPLSERISPELPLTAINRRSDTRNELVLQSVYNCKCTALLSKQFKITPYAFPRDRWSVSPLISNGPKKFKLELKNAGSCFNLSMGSSPMICSRFTFLLTLSTLSKDDGMLWTTAFCYGDIIIFICACSVMGDVP